MSKVKVDLIDQLPNNQEKRKLLEQIVEELVDSKLRASGEAEFQKEILQNAKEEHLFCPKFLRGLAMIRFGDEHRDGKVRKKIEDNGELLTIVDLLT